VTFDILQLTHNSIIVYFVQYLLLLDTICVLFMNIFWIKIMLVLLITQF